MACNLSDELYQDVCFMIGHLVICMSESGLSVDVQNIISQLEYRLIEKHSIPEELTETVIAAINALRSVSV